LRRPSRITLGVYAGYSAKASVLGQCVGKLWSDCSRPSPPTYQLSGGKAVTSCSVAGHALGTAGEHVAIGLLNLHGTSVLLGKDTN